MCNCIDQVNEALAPHNEQLNIGLRIDLRTGKRLAVRPQIAVAKIDSKKRGRAIDLCAVFCPFCGERYEEVNDGS